MKGDTETRKRDTKRTLTLPEVTVRRRRFFREASRRGRVSMKNASLKRGFLAAEEGFARLRRFACIRRCSSIALRDLGGESSTG